MNEINPKLSYKLMTPHLRFLFKFVLKQYSYGQFYIKQVTANIPLVYSSCEEIPF